MRATWVLLLVTASGCLASANLRGNTHGLDGGGINMEGPVSRLRFGTEAVYERVSTDVSRRGVFGYDVTARIGIVSAALQERCEHCFVQPWIDVGPAVGLGAAVTGDASLIGHAWFGGWADVRISKILEHSSYWIMRLELQRDGYSGPYVGDTQLVVGVGYVDWDFSLK